MNQKWLVIPVVLLIVGALYLVELSKIIDSSTYQLATLDALDVNKTASEWEPFYRVRASIVDGQSASFSIPKELKNKEGQMLHLTGAGVFYGSGCTRTGDSIVVREFYLVPSLGLANACVIQPDVEMRWKVRIMLQDSWVIHRDDMISNLSRVKGRFRINTVRPYDGVFFLDNAVAELIPNESSFE